MAIRSTNANRSSKQYQNQDGPGGRTIDYGPSRGESPFANGAAPHGMSPWYGDDGNAMPWSGPPGQQRGQRAPRYTPDAGDPRNDGYYVQETPDQAQAWQQGNDQRNAAQRTAYGANEGMSAARGSGDVRGYIQAMQAMKAQGQQDRFVGQGGTPEVWQDRFNPNNNWPVPRSPGGAPPPSHGPGRPDFQGGAPPPMPTGRNGGRGGMIEGYQPGPSSPMSAGQGGDPRMQQSMQRMLGSLSSGGGMGGGAMDPRMMQQLQMQMQQARGQFGGASTGQGESFNSPMSAQGGRTPPWQPFDPGTGGRQPLPQPPNQGPPQDPRMPRQDSPWNPTGAYPGGGGFNGQMPMERMGGMLGFGYSPYGGGGGYRPRAQGWY